MDFDQLATFLEVARTLSFSLAAKRRFLTQPAVSAQIRALEQVCGAKLFERAGRRTHITEAGKVFQIYAEDTMNRRKLMLASLTDLDHSPQGVLSIGSPESAVLYVLSDAISAFIREFKDVTLNLVRGDSATILERVFTDTVDLGIVSGPVDGARLHVQTVRPDRMVLVVPPGHALAKKKSVALGELAHFPLVLQSSGRIRRTINACFTSVRSVPTVAMEADSTEILKRYVTLGAGIAVLPFSNVSEDVGKRSLVAVPLAGVPDEHELSLVYRKDKVLSRAALAFTEHLLQSQRNS